MPSSDSNPLRGATRSAAPLRRLGDAAACLSAGRLQDAVAALGEVLAVFPTHAEALRMLGIVLHKSGRHDDAVDAYRQALQSAPADALIWNNLGSAERARGNAAAAEQAFTRAVELMPGLAPAWYNLGKMLKTQGSIEQARAALERAVRIDPRHVRARVALGETLRSLGDVDAAVSMFREAIDVDASAGGAWYALADLKTYRFDPGQAERMRRLLDDGRLDDEQRVFVGFALAKALDDLGRYDEAWATLVQANHLKHATFADWDPRVAERHYRRIGEAFADGGFEPLDPHLGAEVIFVVSLPRSGSTLTEQILAAHSQVATTGEIPDLADVVDVESARRGKVFPDWVGDATAADWDRLGREYLARAARWHEGRPRFTDKSLANWPLVGAIRRMLPAARIVSCRRDPVETCLSCYRQLFARSHEYSYDLGDLATQWRSHDRLMRQWLAQFPAQVFDSRYEDLVREPERRIPALLAFCGLPFEDACLAPHRVERSVRTASAAQVRQPIGATSRRAMHYPAAEADLRKRLGVAGTRGSDG